MKKSMKRFCSMILLSSALVTLPICGDVELPIPLPLPVAS